MSGNFTHLDKIFWPQERYTKGDVIAYYEKIAPYRLPYLKDRAESLNGFPDGIRGKHFYQKNVDPKQLPRFVKSVSLRAKAAGKTVCYIMCNNKDTLLYRPNRGGSVFAPAMARRDRLRSPGVARGEEGSAPGAIYDQDDLQTAQDQG